MNKYRNVKTVVDNITFASKTEARRYGELKLLDKARDITQLKLQPRYEISINGIKICTYIADFQYWDLNSREILVVEDVKGIQTPVYKLKKKLMKAVHGIEITEIK